MNGTTLRVLVIALSGVMILGTGFWLARADRPYDGILFNAHKLLALAAIVLFAVTLARTDSGAAWNAWKVTAVAVAGAAFLVLLVTGGLHSIDAAGGLPADARLVRAVVAISHKVVPWVAAVSASMALLLWRVGL